MVFDAVDVGVAVFAIPNLHESSCAGAVGFLRLGCRADDLQREGGASRKVADEGEFVEDQVAVEVIELARNEDACGVGSAGGIGGYYFSRENRCNVFAKSFVEINHDRYVVAVDGRGVGHLDGEFLGRGGDGYG